MYAARKIIIKDTSVDYLWALVQNAPKNLENENDLEKELAAPLPDMTFLTGNKINDLDISVMPLVESQDEENVTVQLSQLIIERINMEWTEGSEIDVGYLSHSLTGAIWQCVDSLTHVLRLSHGQDLADPSGATIKCLRPDYCLWVNGALLLKAERKRDWRELELAKSELEMKMNAWNPVALRGLPFLPCFAVGGRSIQFCALFPPIHDGARPQLRIVSDIFNMSTRFGRMWVMRIALNMLRVLWVLRAKLPSTVPMLYAPQRRSLGGYVMIMDDFVQKRCQPAAESEIYECLNPDSKLRLPCAIRVTRGHTHANGMEDLEIRPVCLQELPASVDELRVAIRCVVTALREFHARGFVHRDVRWPNVLRDRNLWLLSDFELAARDGAELPLNAVDPEYLPPEVNACRSYRYSAAGDMFCVGRLIRLWAAGKGGNLPSEAKELATRLMDTDPDKRPSAAALLAESGSWLNG